MESFDYVRFLLALVFVLGLIGFCAWLGKRAGLTPRAAKRGNTDNRLSLLEVRPIDAKRKLILIRRDERQHLLMIGGDNDLVIECNISGDTAPEDRNATPSHRLSTDDQT